MSTKNQGIEQTLDRLLAEYGGLVRQAIRRTFPRASAAQIDDIEQDARVRLWKTLERETQINAPPSFLYRVAVTSALDALRRVRRRREISSDDERLEGMPQCEPVEWASTPEQQAARREILESVTQQLGAMPAPRQQAVRLHLQGFTPTEIAELSGWTEPKARNLVYRGLNQLRERLADAGIDYEAQ